MKELRQCYPKSRMDAISLEEKMASSEDKAGSSRSAQMALIRCKDTKPEMRVRQALHAAGLRYRLHDHRLPGTPDLVFPSRRVALFVHGCFWHRHPGCSAARLPKSRLDFWEPKLTGNAARDRKQHAALEALGWIVFVIWECETRNSVKLADLAAQIRAVKPTRQQRGKQESTKKNRASERKD